MTMWMIETTRGMGGCLKNGDYDMIIRWYHEGFDDHDNIVRILKIDHDNVVSIIISANCRNTLGVRCPQDGDKKQLWIQ